MRSVVKRVALSPAADWGEAMLPDWARGVQPRNYLGFLPARLEGEAPDRISFLLRTESMPALYENHGVSFQYPENWELDEADLSVGQREVTIFSPQGAFWSLGVFPPAVSPADAGRAAVDAMREEYEDVEVEEAADEIAGHRLTGFNLNFFYLDLTSTAIVRTLRTDQATYTIFYQAEDREFIQLEQVFQAVTFSLLSQIKDLSFRGKNGSAE